MKYQLLGADELALFRARLGAVLGVLGVAVALLLFRLWYLQVLNGSYYEEVAQGNRIRVVPEEAPRGTVYDRNGEMKRRFNISF